MDGIPASPTLEELLKHRARVRRLATRVAGGSCEADDLEQEAWLASLRRAPASASGKLEAWLGQVVRNAMRQGRRSEARRRARERAAARLESVPSTHDVVARAEIHRRVVDAVLALEEPMRSTILLRYFDGMPARRIASLRSEPIETVRTRLKRAHAQLRGTLAQLTETTAPSQQRTRRPRQYSVAPWTGIALYKAKAALSVVVVALALAAGYFVSLGGRAPTDPPIEPIAILALEDAGTEARPSGDREEALRRSAREASAAPKAGGRTLAVHARLIGLDAGVAWTSAIAVVTGKRTIATAIPHAGLVSIPIDAASGLPEHLALRANDERYLCEEVVLSRARIVNSESDAIELHVRVASILRGRVELENGSAASGAHLSFFALRNDGRPTRTPFAEIDADDKGRYRAKTSYVGPCIALARLRSAERQRPTLQPQTQRGVAHGGQETLLPTHVLGVGHSIAGSLRWADGSPVARATLRIEAQESALTLVPKDRDWAWWKNGDVGLSDTEVTTDASGRFSSSGFPRKRFRVSFLWLEGCLAACEQERLVHAPNPGVDMVVDAAVLRLSVSSGRRIGAKVLLKQGQRMQSSPIPESGSVRLVLGPGQAYEVEVSAPQHSTESFRIAPKRALTLPPRTITLRRRMPNDVIVELRGCPAKIVSLTWRDAKSGKVIAVHDKTDQSKGAASSDANARFVVSGLKPGSYELEVARPRRCDKIWSSLLVGARARVQVAPVGNTRVVVDARIGGRLRIAARDERGIYYAGQVEIRDDRGTLVPLVFACGDAGGYVWGRAGQLHDRGVNEALKALAPGSYTLRCTLDERKLPFERHFEIRRGDVTLVRLDVAQR